MDASRVTPETTEILQLAGRALAAGDPEQVSEAALAVMDRASTALEAGENDRARQLYAATLELSDRANTARAHSAGAIAAWQLGLAEREDESAIPNPYWPRAVAHALAADHPVAFQAGTRAASLEAMRLEPGDPESALEYWRHTIALSERLPEDERTLLSSSARFAGQILYRQGDREGAGALLELAVDMAPVDETPGQRYWAAGAAFAKGQECDEDDAAALWFAKAFRLAKDSEGPEALGLAAAALHRHTCVSESALGPEERIRRFAAAAEFGEQCGTPRGLSWAAMALRQLVFVRGAGDQAPEDYEMLERAADLGRRSGLTEALENAAGIEYDLGVRYSRADREDESRRAYERAIQFAQQIATPNARMVEAWACFDLARFALRRDDVAAAIPMLEQARRTGLESGAESARFTACDATLKLGRILWKRDGAAEAEPVLRHAIDIGADAADADTREYAGDAAVALGLVLKELGRVPEALQTLQRGRALAASSPKASARDSETSAALELGHLLDVEGSTDAALTAFTDAVRLGRESKTHFGVRQAAVAASGQARLFEKLGRRADAQDAWALTYNLARRLGEDDSVGKILAVTAQLQMDHE